MRRGIYLSDAGKAAPEKLKTVIRHPVGREGSAVTTKEIRQRLFALQDTKYRTFQAKLIPTIAPETIIGVRTPELRKLAKELSVRPDIEVFLRELPHELFEENQLHIFIISGMKNFENCLEHTEKFLPFIDNWATCDQLSPKVFKKYKKELLPHIQDWILSGETYKVRFAIGMLMQHFLDEDFDPAYPETVAAIRSDEYYINMMIAWYFATALAKQYDDALPYMEQRHLERWTHNKAIQKSIESYRITPEQKEYLRSLKKA